MNYDFDMSFALKQQLDAGRYPVDKIRSEVKKRKDHIYKLISIYDKYSAIFSIHNHIDNLMKEHIEGYSKKGMKSFCKMHCSHCCRQLVSATKLEAEMAVNCSQLKKIKINKSILKKQLKILDHRSFITELDRSDRKCVFLSKNGLCRVYDNRPSACRLHISYGESKLCDTDIIDGVNKYAFSLEAEIWASAIFMVDQKTNNTFHRLVYDIIN